VRVLCVAVDVTEGGEVAVAEGRKEAGRRRWQRRYVSPNDPLSLEGTRLAFRGKKLKKDAFILYFFPA
jgi:hypothetical protein